jgi:hypothetical protein
MVALPEDLRRAEPSTRLPPSRTWRRHRRSPRSGPRGISGLRVATGWYLVDDFSITAWSGFVMPCRARRVLELHDDRLRTVGSPPD